MHKYDYKMAIVLAALCKKGSGLHTISAYKRAGIDPVDGIKAAIRFAAAKAEISLSDSDESGISACVLRELFPQKDRLAKTAIRRRLGDLKKEIASEQVIAVYKRRIADAKKTLTSGSVEYCAFQAYESFIYCKAHHFARKVQRGEFTINEVKELLSTTEGAFFAKRIPQCVDRELADRMLAILKLEAKQISDATPFFTDRALYSYRCASRIAKAAAISLDRAAWDKSLTAVFALAFCILQGRRIVEDFADLVKTI